MAVRNGLLASLPLHALTSLLPKLSPVDVVVPSILYDADSVIEAVYFPVSGMISLIAELEICSKAEVGIIGREGMLGMPLLSKVKTSFVKAMVQLPGTMLWMTAEDFRHAMEVNHFLRAALLLYGEFMHAQVTQTVACHKRHEIKQRLARWLLMTHDCADDDEVPLTYNYLAMMLGVIQPGISEAAAELQRKNVIRYTTSHITVLDRAGLENASCGCYARLRQRFVDLLGKPLVPVHRAG